MAANKYPSLYDLEGWLYEQNKKDFPSYNEENQKSFPDRYKDLKTGLGALHDQVERGATIRSFLDGKDELIKLFKELSDNGNKSINVNETIELLENWEPLIYLNQHGKGHVAKVIEKAAMILNNFKSARDMLSPFETFILLCAIQIHDIGNINGRKDHETSFNKKFREKASAAGIVESATLKTIFRIARVHSGSILGNKDTISQGQLTPKQDLLNFPIRLQLLAALLRFADELADDSTRAIEYDDMPEESRIFHAYSRALHTVTIQKNDITNTYFVKLCYELSSEDALRVYVKGEKRVPFIQEVFDRSKKMEQERRYCIRYLNQYIPLTEVKVEIEISHPTDVTKELSFEYTLSERGYPLDDVVIDCVYNDAATVRDGLIKKGMMDQ